jgi:RimJ/RimL family protein N-acetyltransferase
METFATTRLRAARLGHSDLPDLVDLHLDSEVSRYLGGVRSPAATADYLAANLRHWAEHGLGLWTLRANDGTFVGRAGLRYVDVEGARELEIAYALGRPAWGRGLGSEIGRALVAIFETQCSDASLVGLVMKGNAASERVLLKLGFRYERDAVFHEAVCGLFRLRR